VLACRVSPLAHLKKKTIGISLWIRAFGTPVWLRVYDLLRRQVSVLVHWFAEAGSHRVSFSAGGSPSGTYVARLEMGRVRQAQKIMLIR